MHPKFFKEVQEKFTAGENASHWTIYQENIEKNLGYRYFEVLADAKVIPTEKDQLNDYVILSPSANQRTLEVEFADRLNLAAQGITKEHQPRIICADGFGEQILTLVNDNGNYQLKKTFKPAFYGKLPQFDNVDIETVSANAGKIPLPDKSVDTIWDRLGAYWFYIQYAYRYHLDINEVIKPLLDEYARVLKDGGKLVIDAGNVEVTNKSSFEYNTNIDFESLGWSVDFAGEDPTKVAILTRSDKQGRAE